MTRSTITPDRKQPPVGTMIAPLEHLMINAEKTIMPNGMLAYMLPQPNAGICRTDLVIPAGTRHQQVPLTAFFTARMLKEGSSGKTGEEIAEILDFYGAYLEINAERDRTALSLYSPKRFLAQILPLVQEIWTDASFPEDILEIEKKHQKQEYFVNDQRVAWVAKREFNPLIFGDEHPYGKTAVADDFDAVRREQLVSFHQQHYFSKENYLILSGDVDPKLIALVSASLGSKELNSIESPKPELPSALPSIKREAYIPRSLALQSAIRMGRVLIPRSHPDFMALQVVVTLLGGFFGSRLMKNIREDKGYTYGIGAFIQPYEYNSAFIISTEVGSGYTQATLEEIYKELRELRDGTVSRSEMELVRNYLMGSLQRALDGSLARAERLRGIVESGEDLDYFLRFRQKVLNLTAMDVRELTAKYFQEDMMTTLVVGKEKEEVV